MENNNEFYDGEVKNEGAKEVKNENKHKGRGIVFIMGILLSLTLGVAIGSLDFFADNESKIEDNNSQNINEIYSSIIKTAAATNSNELSIKDIAMLTANSVVEITTETVTRGSIMGQYVYEGAGSGVIIASDGYIVTNNHVIENANKVMVKLKNEEVYEASVVGRSSEADIAVLKIEANNLQPVVLGDSSELVVGDTAVVVGNPLGAGATVTNGIISALEREIDLGDVVMNLLQTNAAINPGNSGGGLFNSRGELVGIIVAKSAGEDIEGIGFAIPINDIRDTISEIKTYGYIRGRVLLGVNLLSIDNAWDAMMYGLDNTGVYIRSVEEKSDAKRAGLKSGDKIVSIDGVNISTAAEVKSAISNKAPNDIVTINVIRNGREISIRVKLTEYKGE